MLDPYDAMRQKLRGSRNSKIELGRKQLRRTLPYPFSSGVKWPLYAYQIKALPSEAG